MIEWIELMDKRVIMLTVYMHEFLANNKQVNKADTNN